jgi:Ca-activated chloride channel family protein
VRTIVVVAVLAAFSGFEHPAVSAQSLPTFKSSVDVVPISAVVRDRRGRMVTTLASDDFEVLDKGERRPILDFQIDQTSPITMAVLVDVSGSMRLGSKLALSREVLTHLVADLREGRDEVGLFTFDDILHEQQAFTVHTTSIDAALNGAEPFGTTSLYDAIAETAQRLGARPSRRRAIVVLTDGVDTSSALTPSEVSSLASAIDAPVYVVVTGPPIDRAAYLDRTTRRNAQSPADLRDLAAWTGGDLLWVTPGENAALRAHQILSELRHQYLIAIESATDREWRPIDVRVRDRRLSVRARSGYFSRDNALSR